MPSIPWGVTWRKALVSAPRILPDAVLRITSAQGPHPFVIQLPSRGSHQIPVYVFIPPTIENPSIPLPIVVDFHGGGFVLGSCHEQAPFCAQICRELGCVAISVDYRLGPYAQFPAALEDAEDVINAILKLSEPGYASLRSGINDWLSSKDRSTIKLDPSHIALSGFSSGGNLVLNLVMSMRSPPFSKAWPSVFSGSFTNQIPVLMYFAAIDLRKLPSEREIIDGFHEVPKTLLASLQLEQHLMPTYLPQEERTNIRASPALADIDGLHAQARCLLLLAEKDSLSRQNEEWAEKVRQSGRGNDVTIQTFIGATHGWTQYPDSWLDATALAAKYEAHKRAIEHVRGCWASTTRT